MLPRIVMTYSGVPNSVGALVVWEGQKFPKSNSMGGANSMGERKKERKKERNVFIF